MFVHEYDGKKVWIIGLIDIVNRNIRMEIVHKRNEVIMKEIIMHHIGINNTIKTDGWDAYNLLNDINYHYNHIVHIHGRYQFGYGKEFTSHIE